MTKVIIIAILIMMTSNFTQTYGTQLSSSNYLTTASILQNSMGTKIKDYEPIFLSCKNSSQLDLIAIRKFKNNNTEFTLVVEPNFLKTKILRSSELNCQPLEITKFNETYYGKTLIAASSNSNTKFLQNAGLQKFLSREVYLTVDMCPSAKPFENSLFSWVEKTKSPMAVALTATWAIGHKQEFERLKNIHFLNSNVSWINHSYFHPYKINLPFEQNFLLMSGINIEKEVLGNEIFMIENEITPSVFFRFPGLVSNQALIQNSQTGV